VTCQRRSFAKSPANGRYLRIPAEDLTRRRFGSGGTVKGVGAYTAEFRGSNPLSSTRKSAQWHLIQFTRKAFGGPQNASFYTAKQSSTEA
jgi:hypothetical protein